MTRDEVIAAIDSFRFHVSSEDEHSLLDLRSAFDDLYAERDAALKEGLALTVEKEGMLILIKDLYRERDGWKDRAIQLQKGQNYYTSLLDEIGKTFGPPAYIVDDGSHSIEPLRAKLPEVATALVAEQVAKDKEIAALTAKVQELEEEVKWLSENGVF